MGHKNIRKAVLDKTRTRSGPSGILGKPKREKSFWEEKKKRAVFFPVENILKRA